ncbi:hypothetical protein GPA19_18150 [Azoarcus indigens]|uniref:Opacity protein-like surface antigen n=1 Tax=Azoarcus indigens TaxID=29545 RepID=A0A4R6DP60_9RHOO|nr:acyloxyacyl hydrolase [Azoarcus indigens]NMG66865.1 hypothetical protein [Azoarcus indigens]TDN46707.1 opacity protein-like surface antigen [Azoarcus indigens]
MPHLPAGVLRLSGQPGSPGPHRGATRLSLQHQNDKIFSRSANAGPATHAGQAIPGSTLPFQESTMYPASPRICSSSASRRRSPSLSRQLASLAAGAVLGLAVAPLAHAEDDGPEIILRYGESGQHYERSGIGFRFSPVWSDDWGNWKATLRPELELSQMHYSGSKNGPNDLTQGGAIAVFRVHYGSAAIRPYFEAGLGAGLFSQSKLGAKEFSTHFQFSEHLGAGLEFAKRWYAGYQFSHYSNADIELPNDGIDLHQIMVGLRF